MIHNIFPIPISISNIGNYNKDEMISYIDEFQKGTFGDDENIDQLHNQPIFNHLN